MTDSLIIERYQLEEEIGQGGIGTVYRAHDSLLDRDVAVKVVNKASMGDKDRARLLREAKAIAKLNHPNIVMVFDAGEINDSPFIVEELVVGRSLRDHHPIDLEGILFIIRQICAALEHAHENGIIHRDLKPENVIIMPDGKAKLMDFSVAYSKVSTLSEDEVISGTLFYLSPEQALGQEVDQRADLYSLGVMLYELIAGQLPFTGDNVLALINQHLHGSVVPPREYNPEIPSSLDTLILRLLAKSPQDRPISAAEVSEMLEEIQVSGIPLPESKSKTFEFALPSTSETKITPYFPAFLNEVQDQIELKAEKFIRRQQELVQLNNFLEQVRIGEGKVVFISGEAGSGKTALMQAFAHRAQNSYSDIMVAWGNCNAYSGIGHPFLPFQDVFSMLTGDVEAKWAVGDLSRTAAMRMWELMPTTVEAIVRHGPDLIGRIVVEEGLAARVAGSETNAARWIERINVLSNRSQVYGQEMQQSQLFEQCVSVLQALSAKHPLILVLDDLQWADAASLGLLFHLGRRVGGSRILIVGVYRSHDIAQGRDNARHPLETMIHEFKRLFGDIVINLDDISAEENRFFVDTYLDLEPNQLGGEFRQSLYEHTRGHALFIIELLRSMQERGDLIQNEKGEWTIGHQLDWTKIPAQLEGIIAERVSRLDKPLRELLDVASVEGETFTLEVIAGVQNSDKRVILRDLSQELVKRHHLVREIGEYYIGSQRFSRFEFIHLIYQSYIYNQLGEAEKLLLHERIADQLEEIYQGHLDEIAVSLITHYEKVDNKAKTAQFLQLAGERALRQFAYQEAIDHLSKALVVQLEVEPEFFETSEDMESSQLTQARIHSRLGLAFIGSGSLSLGRNQLSKALSLLDRSPPDKFFKLVFGLTRQLLLQILHRIGPVIFVRKISVSERRTLLEAVRIYSQLATIQYLSNERTLAIYGALRSLNLAERAGSSSELAEAYAQMTVGAGLIPLRFLAEIYSQRAVDVAAEVGIPATIANVAMVTSVYRGGIGQWDSARPELEKALEIFDDLGDLRQWGECLSIMAVNYILEGNYSKGKEVFELLMRSAQERKNSLQEAWALGWATHIAFRKGRTDQSLNLAKKALDILTENEDLSAEFDFYGMLAMAYARIGKLEAGQNAADMALVKIGQSSPNLYSAYIGFAGVAEVSMKIFERTVDADRLQEQRDSAINKLRQTCKELQRFSRIFPIGAPTAYYYFGHYYKLKGNHQKAIAAWRKSHTCAERLGMPYELGLAAFELGQHLSQGDLNREKYLIESIEIFTKLGAQYDLARAKQVRG
jgi:tetratricopeptide (TPR) repeat protein/ABC-type dipeptide/oligopeptide/nickel transport system ATPase subunit